MIKKTEHIPNCSASEKKGIKKWEFIYPCQAILIGPEINKQFVSWKLLAPAQFMVHKPERNIKRKSNLSNNIMKRPFFTKKKNMYLRCKIGMDGCMKKLKYNVCSVFQSLDFN